MSTDSSPEVTPSSAVGTPTAPAASLPKKRVDLAGNVIATGSVSLQLLEFGCVRVWSNHGE